jgi:hypothetical protein
MRADTVARSVRKLRFGRQSALRRVLLAMSFLAAAVPAHAGGPRWYAGPPFFYAQGNPWSLGVGWADPNVTYYTDPGNLSAGVSHAQADAMVAAAAAPWNTSIAAIVLSQAGSLAEHVSSANVQISDDTLTFPADVQSTNTQMPIAIVYDTDGSVTDLLLGSGASAPSGCRQNAVTATVDNIGADGHIHHALILLNGRCVSGPGAPLMQMQYQLMRAFGRVLGLAWSQLNDSIFTGSSTPTAAQYANWPVMHPLDVICGTYTYQCMPNAFALREDDTSSLSGLYPVTTSNQQPGKQLSFANATWMFGWVNFPDGSGMQDVNVVIERDLPGAPNLNTAPQFSAVTGAAYRAGDGTPITGTGSGMDASWGTSTNHSEMTGFFSIGRMQIVTGAYVYNVATAYSEPINPLYAGDYALAPYTGAPVAMSGGQSSAFMWGIVAGNTAGFFLTQSDSPATGCDASQDGTETSPLQVAASGWWTQQTCTLPHTSWRNIPVAAGHAWTLEALALDDSGAASEQKMQPVLGAWLATDPTGTLPTAGMATVPFDTAASGVTQMQMSAASTDTTYRVAVSDARGKFRDDFVWTGRVLYAASASPSLVSVDGGQLVVTGTGLSAHCQVLVNGVAATTLSATQTTLTVLLPTMTAAGGSDGAVLALAIKDKLTGGVATLPQAFAYSSSVQPVRALTTSSAPKYLAAGAFVSWTMSVLVTQNGVPLAQTPVLWSAPAGIAITGAGMVSDASGMASATFTTSASATSGMLTACAWETVCASAPVEIANASQWIVQVLSGAGQSVSAATNFSNVTLMLTDAGGHPLQGATAAIYQTVTAWEGVCTTARCPAAPVIASSQASALTGSDGMIVVVPLVVSNTPGTTSIAVASGTLGFATLTLTRSP